MWQRVQTIFLTLVITSCIVFLFFPIWVTGEEASGTSQQLFPLHYSVLAGGLKTTHYYPYAITAILVIAAATLAALSLRSYGNRMTQLKMGALNSVFLAGAMLAAVIFAKQMLERFGGQISYLSLGLMMVAVLTNFLANRFIRRDEKIVRDSNRLR
jgi:hypothetical protein